MLLQRDEVEVAERFDEADARRRGVDGGETLPCPRMHGEDEWKAPADRRQRRHEKTKRLGLIDIRRPVQRDEAVASVRREILSRWTNALRSTEEDGSAIDHDVADAMNAALRDSFAQKIRVAVSMG